MINFQNNFNSGPLGKNTPGMFANNKSVGSRNETSIRLIRTNMAQIQKQILQKKALLLKKKLKKRTKNRSNFQYSKPYPNPKPNPKTSPNS